MEKLYKLSEVLASAHKFAYDTVLFLDKNHNWDGNSKCAVLKFDNEIDPQEEGADENPKFAKQNDLIVALHMADVQDIVSNAKQQNPNGDEALLVKAFLYYHDRDAFIDLSQ